MKHRQAQLAAVNKSSQRLKTLVQQKDELMVAFIAEIRGDPGTFCPFSSVFYPILWVR